MQVASEPPLLRYELVPELPEVETIRRNLEPVLRGRTLEHVRILDPRLTRPAPPAAVAAVLEGDRVEEVLRRGKYLVVRLESSRSLLVHLRMTGTFRVHGEGSLPDDPHVRAVVRLDNEADVAYRDVRRFGTWLVTEPAHTERFLDVRLGPEPLSGDFTAAFLARRLGGRRAPVKAAILDQRTVAGLGNIYADEALWRARVHPRRPAGSVISSEIRALHRAIRRALRTGIARNGATLTDYRKPDGERGSMQHEFQVYGRAREPCPRCGSPIDKIRTGGRGTWYCPDCQRLDD